MEITNGWLFGLRPFFGLMPGEGAGRMVWAETVGPVGELGRGRSERSGAA